MGLVNPALTRKGRGEPFLTRPVDPAKIGLCIVPGLAFDLSGNRLGRGVGLL